jgi:hypothetical protein
MIAVVYISAMIQSPMKRLFFTDETEHAFEQAFPCIPVLVLHIFGLYLANTYKVGLVAALPHISFVLSIMIIP